MSRSQRLAVALTAGGLLAVGIMPPWRGVLHHRAGDYVRPLGHHFVGRGPSATNFDSLELDYPRLSLYTILVLIAGSGAVLLMAGNSPERARPDAAVLDAMTDHVAYELVAMRRAASHFAASRHRFSLEAFLLHARNLREFFLGKRRSSTSSERSVYAEDYWDQPAAWRSEKQSLPKAALDRTKGAINAYLSHLSTSRLCTDTASLDSEVESLRQECDAINTRFLAALPEPLRRRFEAAIARKAAEP